MADQQRITAMRTGGKHLRSVKQQLAAFTTVGTRFEDIEALAQELIKAAGAKPSFSTVKDYQWATCIMKNDEMCHGIPRGKVVEDGDVITIDVGLIYDGYHLDTTTSFGCGKVTPAAAEFLAVGQKTLAKAIAKARVGNSIYDISYALQHEVEQHGYGAVFQLTGHGIGKQLHMEPNVPCIAQRSDKRKHLEIGQTLAIEIMYAAGDAYLVVANDGWTYRTKDGSLAGMFEETVLITDKEPEILT